jgi:multiple sugar transport system substrate-binding protein
MAGRTLLAARVGRRLVGACWLALGVACAGGRPGGEEELRVWAFGAEGEALAPIARDFERAHPGIRVRVQQIPWTAAHEKLLTAFVGGALPDVAQLGNTWIPEFAALNALQPLDSLVKADSGAIPLDDYFPGVLATNVVDSVLYGVPWYVDTRVLFYRADLLRAAGVPTVPTTWAAWRDAMVRVRARLAPGGFPALLPLNEWAQPVIFGLQAGSPLLADNGTRAVFSEPPFRRGFELYIGLFRDSLAPALAATQISSVFQEFESGRAAMYITGPWNVGEFRRRIPASVEWATAPLPGPDGPGVSLAGGSSIVIMRGSRRKEAAWRFLAFLADPARQAAFFTRTGDLPARRSAWDAPALAGDRHLAAFRTQLGRVVPSPAVPEMELIASRVAQAAERAARGQETIDEALARLDSDVNLILEKRRWLLSRRAATR